MNRRKKTLLIVAACLVIALIALAPFPVSVDAQGKERVVAHALSALIQNERVLTTRGYIRLHDCDYVKDEGRLYFENMIGVPDSVFLQYGLKPIPTDRELDVNSGDVIISFSHRDIEGKLTNNVQFSYIFGSLGAQGYEIKTYRSLLVRYFVYVHRWVS